MLRGLTEVGRGGTHQARYERDVIEETVRNRLAHLEIGDARAGLRPDRPPTRARPSTSAASPWPTSDQEPVVVDWRAPVAEPFYRATGRAPMGLARRRHFATGRRSSASRTSSSASPTASRRRHDGLDRPGRADRRARAAAAPAGSATSSPPSRASRTRSSARRCPACSSCRAARAPARPSWRCTAPPTCSTRTASRSRARACSSSARTALFLGYIEQVLPSLGEAGCRAGGARRSRAGGAGARRPTRPSTARIKGDVRMATLLANAVRDRQRPLTRRPRRAVRAHPAPDRRRDVAAHRARCAAGARTRTTRAASSSSSPCSTRSPASSRDQIDARTVRERTRSTDEVRAALEAMWPVLTPAQLCTTCSAPRRSCDSPRGRLLDDE